jgi:hypothetical protein
MSALAGAARRGDLTKSLLDKLSAGEHSILSLGVPEHFNRLKQDMGSYPSCCPVQAKRPRRALKQLTGIVPDATRRASIGRA